MWNDSLQSTTTNSLQQWLPYYQQNDQNSNSHHPPNPHSFPPPLPPEPYSSSECKLSSSDGYFTNKYSEWTCSYCWKTNSSSQKNCYYCRTIKPINSSSSGYNSGEADWICPESSCQTINFFRRNHCFQCKCSKPARLLKCNDCNFSLYGQEFCSQCQKQQQNSLNSRDTHYDSLREHRLSVQEKQFDEMFANWENNFAKWKEDNKNNPNQTYVNGHISEMTRLRSQMILRRDKLRQMTRDKKNNVSLEGKKQKNHTFLPSLKIDNQIPGLENEKNHQETPFSSKLTDEDFVNISKAVQYIDEKKQRQSTSWKSPIIIDYKKEIQIIDHSSKNIFRSRSPLDNNSRESRSQSSPLDLQKNPASLFHIENETLGKTLNVEEILEPPGRYTRPPKIIIIFRGLPGSGKTFVAKAIKSRECELSAEAPRILSLDDYFDVDGIYQYNSSLETSYRSNLLKSFKKQVDDGYFNFIMVDCIHDKICHYDELRSYARLCGFEVYVAEVQGDIDVCASKNIHKRSREEIEMLYMSWEITPAHHDKLNLSSLLSSKEKNSVERVNESKDYVSKKETEENKDAEKNDLTSSFKLSKWEVLDNEHKNVHMNNLDGVSNKARSRLKTHMSIEDWLELETLSVESSNVKGRKRVRWADIEERKNIDKRREVGFIIGQNWSNMLPSYEGDSALTKTKIIPNRFQEY